jgi:large repetitive protein
MKNLFFLLLITNFAFGQISPIDDITKPQFAGINETESVAVVTNPVILPQYPYVLCGSSTLGLNASPTNAAYTYQWSFSSAESGPYTNISGAIGSIYGAPSAGYYKVSINDGTAATITPAFKVRNGATATFTASNNTGAITIASSLGVNMFVNFTGTPPWNYVLQANNGDFSKDYTTWNVNDVIALIPDAYRNFNISNFNDFEGIGCPVNQTVTVNVAPLPTFSLGPLSITTLCAGNILDIPITYSGTWGDQSRVQITGELTTTTGANIFGSFEYGLQGNSIKYLIPVGTPVGTYKVRLFGQFPSTPSVLSGFNVNVVNTGCASNQAIIVGKSSGCSVSLNAYPQGSGYTYQWYKNGVAISGATNLYYQPFITDNYSVQIINTSLGYNATSAAKSVIVNNFNGTPVNVTNNTLCNGTSTLTSTYTGIGYEYQWYKQQTINGISVTNIVVGATNPSVTVSTPGNYYCRTWDGLCNWGTNYNTIVACPPPVTSTNPVICGANTQATLNTSTVGSNYQWSFSTTSFGSFTNVSGATTNSHTTSTIGYYKVTVDGNVSNAFSVQGSPYAVVLNSNGSTNNVSIAAGASTTLTYNLYGTAPFTFISSDGVNQRVIYSPTNQITLTHTPPSSRFFGTQGISSAGCSVTGNGQNSILVNVGTVPTISIGTVASSICAGDILSVPYTMSGTFDSNVQVNAQIYNASTNAYVNIVNWSYLNPLQFQIPSNLATGNYYLSLFGNLPIFFSNSSTRTPNFAVTAACTPTAQASIQGFSNTCNSIGLTAIPSGSGYSYQWSKNGSIISGETFSSYYATQSGSYVVTVTNSSNGYSSTSAPKVITITGTIPVITSPNPSLCGTNTSVTLSTVFTGAGYTYLWQKYNTSNFSYNTVAGQTTQNLTLTQASEAGKYRVVVNDGTCDNISQDFTVATGTTASLVNSSGNTNIVNLNPGQTETLQLKMNGQSPFTYTFNGQSYTSNSSTVSLPVSPSVSTNYNVFSILSSGTACGTSSVSTNSILVNVSPNPSFTIGTIPTTACAGGSMEIPLNLTGNWGAAGNERFYVYLYTAAGSYVSFIGSFSATPLFVTIPSNLVVGTSYKFQLSANIPYISGSQFSSNFTFSTTCPAPPNANFTIQNSTCYFPTLTAFPNGAGYVFQWKKDGVDIAGANSQTYSPQVSGNYSVNIQNVGLSYNSTSIVKAVTVNAVSVTVSSPNAIICGSNTSVTLTSSYSGAGFTYQWRKAPLSGGSYTNIVGATNATLTTIDAGRYFVEVNNGTCTFSSNTNVFFVTYGGTATLTNSMDTNNKVILNPPTTTENLKVNLTGTGPWEVGINDGTTIKIYTANSTPLIVLVSPTFNNTYYISSVTSACGTGRGTGSVEVEPAPVAAFTFPTPSNLTVCRGNFITVPYTSSGNLAANTAISVLLADATGGSSRGVYSVAQAFLDPPQASGTFDVYIPTNITLGSYSLLFGGVGIPQNYFTTYAINVVNTGCPATPAPVIYGKSSGCDAVSLYSSFYAGFGGDNNTHQWYKNGVALTGKTSSSLTVYESGNYTVQVINGAYNQTSAAKSVTVNRVIPTVSTSNSVICGSNTSTTLSTNYTGAGYSYQWYKDRNFGNGTTEQIPIFGETNSSITVANAGAYSVKIFDGSCLQNSKSSSVDASGSLVPTSAFLISNTATAKLTNLAGDNTAVTIGGAATSATLRVTFTGGGPWSFDLVGSDGNTTAYTNVATQVFDFTVSPTTNTNYSIANLTSSCGVGLSSGTLTVIVSSPPSFVANAPSAPNSAGIDIKNNNNTNICPGSTITIGYTIAGNWSADRNMVVELVNASTNAVIAGTTQNGYNTNPILYFVPYNVPVGTYKLKLTSIKPFIESSVLSSTVTITNTACSTPQATIRSKSSCSSSLLSATPSGSGFTYQWYNGSTLIPNAISSDYNATADGNYSVTISNTSQGYTATSNVYVVAIEEINNAISASSGSICNAGGNVTFTSNNVGGSYTHQWYSSSDNVYFSPISGATTNTYAATTVGYYNVIIKNTGCELKSNTLNTCIASLNFSAKTVCANSGVSLPFSFSGGENQTITIQLIDATTNAVVQANLLTLNSTIATLYNPTVNIPNTVMAGTYKFKLITTAPSNVSIISSGILTVSNQTGGIAPVLSASVSSVSSVQNVTITAVGCVGDITWNNSDQIFQEFPSFTSLVSKNTTYSAICKDFATGCISAEGNTTVTYSCADAFEPNNSTTAATAIAPNSFTSPVICLNGFDNPDWFSWSLNGHTYFIKASLTSSQVSAGNYKFKLTYDNTNLTVETIPETVGQSLDTYLTLFDSDGVTVLSMNDNENGNGFSKIIYALANINPCVSALVLNNITDDISSGTIIKEANAITGTITATNKIYGTAKVTYRAGKSITLDAGFKADNGTVFKTEFGGCN